MSDRIYELANEIGAGWQDCPFCGQRPRYRVISPVISWDVESDALKCDALWHTLRPGDALNELATIAREAEAMVDWLVQYAADCGECPRTRYDENEDGCRECLDSIRRSAREAVKQDER